MCNTGKSNLKKLMTIFTVVFLLLFIAAGCGMKKNTPQSQEEKVPVKVLDLKALTVSEFQEFPALLEAEGQIALVSKMSGKVEKVLVKEGQEVKKGDALIRLETKDVMNQVNQAKAAYDLALSNYSRIKNSQSVQEVERLESAVTQAELNYNNVLNNYEKMKNLYEQGAISKQQFENVELQYKIAKEQLESAKTQLSLTKEKAIPDMIEGAKAQLDQAKAALDTAMSALENTVITAPADGTVGSINVKEGQFVGAGTVVAALGNIKALEVKVYLPENKVNAVKPKDKAVIKVDAAGYSGEGEIADVGVYKDPKTQTYPVKVIVNNDKGLLKPGMLAKVGIKVKELEGLFVPENAVVSFGQDKAVFVVSDNTAYLRKVKVGDTLSGYVQLLEGVKEGEKVVVEGQDYLEDKDKVEIISGSEK
ncbi:efflux RND transporter periplasmic adaptor subunit [Thermovenabulum gondwanense]|uniref:Efflux pump periplasmic linker BepF n=1 Tax=Thermovenabulum gondwanense TaxID=520767 RepID=A0A162MWV4_9FIRM|nr:efflux RND transporter periplasmic adaptor subunit [Thermovenabulum gondwanense]KYO68048.1 Efflux pump periplasmic linker BepF [Thermovenabulum gondwanense]